MFSFDLLLFCLLNLLSRLCSQFFYILLTLPNPVHPNLAHVSFFLLSIQFARNRLVVLEDLVYEKFVYMRNVYLPIICIPHACLVQCRNYACQTSTSLESYFGEVQETWLFMDDLFSVDPSLFCLLILITSLCLQLSHPLDSVPPSPPQQNL